MYYDTPWPRIKKIGELYGKPQKPRDPPRESGLLIYWHPDWPEFTLIPPQEVYRLKLYSRARKHFLDRLARAAKAGFPLYFRGHGPPFTKVMTSDRMILTLEDLLEEEAMWHYGCTKYRHRVNPTICMGRQLVWPQEICQDKDSKARRKLLRKRMKELRKEEKPDKREMKYLRRELKKLNPTFDPYPFCRRCPVGEKLWFDACFGAEYDPEDPDCMECQRQKECCQIMRLRIEKTLEGAAGEEEVIKDFLDQVKVHRKHLKQQKQEAEEMAKKKKKAEDVTEEVVEKPAETTKKKKKSRKKKDKDATTTTKKKSRKKKKKAETEEEETPKEKKATGKKKTKKAVKAEINELLEQLAEAKEEGDKSAAAKIRKQLRALGYKLSEQK